MAVQKSRKSSSRSKMKRRYSFKIYPISKDIQTEENHIRHHITKKGYYRGIKVI